MLDERTHHVVLTVGEYVVVAGTVVVDSAVDARRRVVVVELATLRRLDPAAHRTLGHAGRLKRRRRWINGTHVLSLSTAVPVVDGQELDLCAASFNEFSDFYRETLCYRGIYL